MLNTILDFMSSYWWIVAIALSAVFYKAIFRLFGIVIVPEDKIGLMYEDIGGYQSGDMEFVIGFDVDRRKVNRPLAEALRAEPNCAMDHVASIDDTSNGFGSIKPGATVYSGPEYDGVAPHMLEYPEEV